MKAQTTIGIVGGTGWLGRSIATALLDSGFLSPDALMLSSRSGVFSDPKGALSGVRVTADNQELVLQSDIVILSVRPEDLGAVRIHVQDKLLVSLIAGVSLADIGLFTQARCVIRAMPNAALEIRKSYTPWLANDQVDAQSKKYIQKLFETCGSADEVFSERDLSYLTALTGTGPSYPALLAQALYNDAIKHGLSQAMAQRAVMGVVVQASQLMSEERGFNELLEVLREYRGVSAAGINGMLEGGLEASVKAGMARAFEVAQSNLFDIRAVEVDKGQLPLGRVD
ncbi:pyrroline-5-carboxylate reductase family protein [Pseudomonas quasicaspiana]|uniref:pyrroline-5-carboxylate reductase family protein n=1 Tax=Pseudomonas quasicaspiana TaxID=2829821 RepID=UPI001E485BBC|nr:pyrroline-5-carboxylate reductase dimerization domain-containing protein [Pseudomonas quasicaspiana]MCD5973143.1 NAD(P)-binding domain-containing protein [Pseudomonas quasicaspiana]